MIKGTTTFEYKPTPLDLEFELWEMNAAEQAEFIKNIATRWYRQTADAQYQIDAVLNEIDNFNHDTQNMIYDFLMYLDRAKFDHVNER